MHWLNKMPNSILRLPLPYFLLVLFVCVSSFVVYGLMWPQAPVSSGDTRGYLALAADMQDLSLARLHDRTPGYPFLLLLSGSLESPTRMLFHIQLALHMLTVYLGVYLLYRLKVRKLGLFLFLILAILPMYSERAAYALTESFTQFLLFSGLVGLILGLYDGRWGWVFWAGLALAFAGITRPTYQVLSIIIVFLLLVFVFIPAWRLYRARLLVLMAVMLAFSGLIVGGMTAYNGINFGFWGLTPYSGFNLSGKTARVLERLPDEHAVARDVLVKYRDRDLIKPHSAHTGAGYIWHPDTQSELMAVTGLDRAELSDYVFQLNLWLIRAAPMEYLSEVGFAFVTYWFPANARLANMESRLLQLLWSLVHFVIMAYFALQLVLLFAYLIFLFNLPALVRSLLVADIPVLQWRSAAYLFAMSIIALTAAVSTVIQTGDARFRVPTDLIILMVTILGMDTLLSVRHTLQTQSKKLVE